MKEILGRIVAAELEERRKQGYDVEALRPLLGKASGSCDALLALSQRIKEAPIRQDWPYEEPDDLESVMAACDPTRRREASRLLSDGEIEARVRSAFLTSVCACILGKPLEEAPYGGLEDIRAAAQASGEWPLRDYVSDAMLTAWGRRNPSWVETTRGRVRYAASDDDITYTIMGMLLLEKRGRDFSHEDMRQLWLENLPIYLCWGPERTVLLRAGLAVLAPDLPYDMDDWAVRLNPGQELCGAMIRADAYGYACPGDPELPHGLHSVTHPLHIGKPAYTVQCLLRRQLPPRLLRKIGRRSSSPRCSMFPSAADFTNRLPTACAWWMTPLLSKMVITRSIPNTARLERGRSYRRSAQSSIP